MDEIEKYYNKFNENKRLQSRHGIVEFTISLEYILKHLKKGDKIIDVGAGTGRYAKALTELGFNVTAVEYVQKNLSMLKENCPGVIAYKGTATNLKKFKDEQFDACILFGPMYHLLSKEDKLKALSEAKRITKKGGIIFIQYLLADYAILRHGFMDKNILTSLKNEKVDNNFNLTQPKPEDLYSYVTLNQIEELTNKAGLTQLAIISPDGPTDYIRPYINKLTEEEFNLYINFVRKNSNNPTTIGASSHVMQILQND